MTKYFKKIFIDLCFQLRKSMFQGIAYPLSFLKEKENLALTIQVHHEDPFSLLTINLGREEGFGGFFEIGWETKCTIHTKQTKVEFFGHKLCGSFVKNPKGKKQEDIWFLKKFDFWIAMVCLSFYAHILGT